MSEDMTLSYDEIIEDFSEEDIKNAKKEFQKRKESGTVSSEVTFEEFILSATSLGLNNLLLEMCIEETVEKLENYIHNNTTALKMLGRSESEIACKNWKFESAIDDLKRLLPDNCLIYGKKDTNT